MRLTLNLKWGLTFFQATEHLKAFIDDCDRRTELAKKRLAETQEELSAEVSSKAEKVHELAESIGKKLALAEQAGAEGKVRLYSFRNLWTVFLELKFNCQFFDGLM